MSMESSPSPSPYNGASGSISLAVVSRFKAATISSASCRSSAVCVCASASVEVELGTTFKCIVALSNRYAAFIDVRVGRSPPDSRHCQSESYPFPRLPDSGAIYHNPPGAPAPGLSRPERRIALSRGPRTPQRWNASLHLGRCALDEEIGQQLHLAMTRAGRARHERDRARRDLGGKRAGDECAAAEDSPFDRHLWQKRHAEPTFHHLHQRREAGRLDRRRLGPASARTARDNRVLAQAVPFFKQHDLTRGDPLHRHRLLARERIVVTGE